MTAVHDVVLKLVTLADDTLTGWQVLDGWNGATNVEHQALVIAWTPTAGTQAVTSNVDVDVGGLDATVETVTVSCSAVAWDGNMEFATKRAAVASMLTDLRAALAANIDLDDTVFDAWLAPTVQWYLDIFPRTDESPAHANVEVDFQITVQVHAE